MSPRGAARALGPAMSRDAPTASLQPRKRPQPPDGPAPLTDRQRDRVAMNDNAFPAGPLSPSAVTSRPSRNRGSELTGSLRTTWRKSDSHCIRAACESCQINHSNEETPMRARTAIDGGKRTVQSSYYGHGISQCDDKKCYPHCRECHVGRKDCDPAFKMFL